MKTHLSNMLGAIVVLAILLALPSAPTVTRAQDNNPKEPSAPAAVAPGAMPIQGKLTNASGTPLTGTYTMTFTLYDAATGGAVVCFDTLDVTVTNGLFNTYMDHCYNGKLTGQKVWLGIQVGTDPEMTPRQVIFPVAYALGLVPGAVVASDSPYDPLSLSTSNTAGKALTLASTAASGTNYAVYATNASPNGHAGYFNNTSSGYGIWSVSTAGTGIYAGSLGTALRASGTTVSISAEGSGKIQSTAKSYLWISGNGIRPFISTDPTIISFDSIGGALIQRGSGGYKNVGLPITITGPLYGQDVKISGVDIYWLGENSDDKITYIRMRKQTGVCATLSCYVDIIDDPADHPCVPADHPTGCTLNYPLTTDNLITSTSGILYLYFELTFHSDTSKIQIGGVRLTLEHN